MRICVEIEKATRGVGVSDEARRCLWAFLEELVAIGID